MWGVFFGKEEVLRRVGGGRVANRSSRQQGSPLLRCDQFNIDVVDDIHSLLHLRRYYYHYDYDSISFHLARPYAASVVTYLVLKVLGTTHQRCVCPAYTFKHHLAS